jgi:hypothetical protein
MKKIVQALFVLLSVASLVFAQENLTSQTAANASGLVEQESVLFENSSHDLQENIAQDSNESTIIEEAFVQEVNNINYLYESIDFDPSNIQSKQLYAKFLELPQTVFTHQRVGVKIEALVTTQAYTHIQTRFIDSKNVAVINPEDSWQTLGNNKLNNEFFLKIYSSDFKLPTFELILFQDDTIVDVVHLEPNNIRYTDISSNDIEFSSIIAQSLDVKVVNARQYSNEEILVVLQLEAFNGNLEDFRLKEYEEQFLMSLEESYPQQTLTFNVIVPIYTKKIEFKYYNTKKNQFDKLSTHIQLDEQLISTQTDLNPNNSSMQLYKKVAVGVAAIFFILIYLFKRKLLYLLIAIVFALVFFYFAKPNDSLIIHKGTNIYILPTNNSTVFHVTQRKQLVEILNKQYNYYKILFKFENQTTKTVGWIKEEDIVEN